MSRDPIAFSSEEEKGSAMEFEPPFCSVQEAIEVLYGHFLFPGEFGLVDAAFVRSLPTGRKLGFALHRFVICFPAAIALSFSLAL